MITLGRRGDIHARRQAVAFLGSKDIVHKLFDELGPRYAERPGGYSRIVRLGPRPGDAAEMVYLELVDTPLVFKTRLEDVPEDEAAEVAEPEAEADEAEPDDGDGEPEPDDEEPEAEEEGAEPEAEAAPVEEAAEAEEDAPEAEADEPEAAVEPETEAEAEPAAEAEGEEPEAEKS
jgi:large subunit ribosomal protein L17